MKFVVCVVNSIDVTQTFQINNDNKEIENCTNILNPWDEFALEAAILQKEKSDGEIIVLTVGGEESDKSLRNALAMGCDSMIRVDINSRRLPQILIASILSAAIKKIGLVDLVFFGRKSSDFETSTIPQMVSQLLDLPFIPDASTINEIKNNCLVSSFHIGPEKITASVETPALIAINKDFAEPRFPSFMGTRKAAKAPIEVWSLQDLGIELDQKIILEPDLVILPVRKIQTEMIKGENATEIVSILESKLQGASL